MAGVPNRIRTYVATGNRRSPGPLDDRDAYPSEAAAIPLGLKVYLTTREARIAYAGK
jgi:hypothetical protein